MKKSLKQYQTMLVIRRFEERVEELFSKGLIAGTAHPAIGQEATAVGVCDSLRKGDYVTSTHRGHGHFIACGGDPSRIMAELFGKETGYSRGRGGSQVMADFKLGFLGANGITGGSIALATGAALSLKQKGTQGLVVCFFGDGAANQGSFHESLNMAAIWKVPVLFVCENNRYAMSMNVEDSMAITDIARRADSYGIPGTAVDGNDLRAVLDVTRKACRRARDGEGPTLIECKTYRRSGHSRGDPRKYRSREEEQAWARRDPIAALAKTLRREGILSSEVDQEIKANVRRIVSAAVKFAKQSPDPDPATLLDGVTV
ncbi:MAG: thiamine pyrophosphate-dependent dehydrogenase E1 component subunit alpha [Verrucomicrobia bacterium]|nr:thiamine pyrophosphate-dependent dehydrogenase E1 component subunit alpha [Verrucomicrobiota bacterium]MDA1086007.1 thiamine pyrophosphate-dependent dehydrogenase E1 component subunit alpha [Verrucomicrobiota bacterium]